MSPKKVKNVAKNKTKNITKKVAKSVLFQVLAIFNISGDFFCFIFGDFDAFNCFAIFFGAVWTRLNFAGVRVVTVCVTQHTPHNMNRVSWGSQHWWSHINIFRRLFCFCMERVTRRYGCVQNRIDCSSHAMNESVIRVSSFMTEPRKLSPYSEAQFVVA